MKKFLLTLLTMTLPLIIFADTIHWTVIFKDTKAIKNVKPAKSQAWCEAHTPTAFVTTPQEIKGKGVSTVNQIWIRYANYKVYDHGNKNLSFSIADAIFSGLENDGKRWELPTKIYEQGFTQSTFFNSVWANQYCRGFMYGYPTQLTKK